MDDIFADHRLREKKLFDELAMRPIVDLVGVVDASGVGGGRTGDEELWTLTLSFDAWRDESGSIHKTPLTMRRKVTGKELKKFQELIDSDSIVRIRGRIAEENSFGSPQGLLERFIRIEANDAELNDVLAELKMPVTFGVADFGTFTLNRQVKWFVAHTSWCGHAIKLNLAAAEGPEVDSALAVARRLWKSSTKWNARVQEFAIQELLGLKNDNWLDEDEHEVSGDEFKQRMTLDAIAVKPDGSFDFWHDDGDLFFGHAIVVSGHIDIGLRDAGIHG